MSNNRMFTSVSRALRVYAVFIFLVCGIGGSYAGEAGLPHAADSGKSVPIFGLKIPQGYRDFKLISVAHEAGNLNDIRAILGNDAAIQAYRQGKESLPDGAIIVRLSWNYVPSEENNKVFGRSQSFVAGSPPDWYLQFMVKDSKRFAATGWLGLCAVRQGGQSRRQRRRCKHAIPVIRLSRTTILCSPTTRRENRAAARFARKDSRRSDIAGLVLRAVAGSGQDRALPQGVAEPPCANRTISMNLRVARATSREGSSAPWRWAPVSSPRCRGWRMPRKPRAPMSRSPLRMASSPMHSSCILRRASRPGY